MRVILYYCHACGLRLRTQEEVDAAVSRGESHTTACCTECAKKGKRVADPVAAESQILKAQFVAEALDDVSADLDEPEAQVSVSEGPIKITTPARGNRQLASARPVVRRTGNTAHFERRETEPGSKRFPIVPVAAGAAGVVVIAAIFLFSGKSAVPVAKDTPQTQSADDSGRTVLPPPTPGGGGPMQPPSSNATEKVSGDAVAMVERAESQIAVQNYRDARESLERARKGTPAADPFTARIDATEKKLVEASKRRLDELLSKAEERAKAEDFDGIFKTVLTTYKVFDLSPEHAALAEKERARYKELQSARARQADEARQKEFAAALAEMEKSLPAAGSLAAPQGKVIFDAGDDAFKGVVRQVDGKMPFADGSKKININRPQIGNVTNKQEFTFQYSAAQPTTVALMANLYVNGKHEVWAGGNLELPAGMNATHTIRFDKNFYQQKTKSDRGGRAFEVINVEFKSIKPGTLAIFRLSVK